MKSHLAAVLLTSLLVPLLAGDSLAREEQGRAPPLPLHTLEGTGGIFSTSTAYLVNPAPEGEVFGRPSAGYMHVFLGEGKSLEAFTLTETLWDRIELGYGFDYLDLGDLPENVERASGDTVTVGEGSVKLHNLNARVQVLREGDFELPWAPTLTLGAHYKVNEGIADIDEDLGGALEDLGIEDDDGWDFTLVASRTLRFLPRPVIVSAGVRYTEAAHLGLLGFTGERRFVAELNAVAFVSDRFLVGAEYRQKPATYTPVPGLLADEDDWLTVVACWLATDRLTIAAGYGRFGKLLDDRANGVFGIALKYEF